MVLETHMKFCVTELDSAEKIFTKNVGEMDQKCAKKRFFEFIEKFCH